MRVEKYDVGCLTDANHAPQRFKHSIISAWKSQHPKLPTNPISLTLFPPKLCQLTELHGSIDVVDHHRTVLVVPDRLQRPAVLTVLANIVVPHQQFLAGDVAPLEIRAHSEDGAVAEPDAHIMGELSIA